MTFDIQLAKEIVLTVWKAGFMTGLVPVFFLLGGLADLFAKRNLTVCAGVENEAMHPSPQRSRSLADTSATAACLEGAVHDTAALTGVARASSKGSMGGA